MASLKDAAGHLWFQAYCMLNKMTPEWFLDPFSWSARGKLDHWQSWVAEQDLSRASEMCHVITLYMLYMDGSGIMFLPPGGYAAAGRGRGDIPGI